MQAAVGTAGTARRAAGSLWRGARRTGALPPPGATVASSANPALARETRVIDFVSPPDVVARKAAELPQVGPSGIKGALTYIAAAPLVWALGAATNAGTLIKGAGAPPPPADKLAAPFPLHEEWVAVDGGRVKLHCVSPGRRNPGKPLMLFVHGFPELWYSWRFQMQEFADDYDVVAVDMRGYNESDRPEGVASYRMARLAADIRDLVAALGHERCTLVAHDWGGCVAWLVAGLYGPALVERLIVMGLPHLGIGQTNIDNDQRSRSSYMLLFQAPVLPEAILTSDGADSMTGMFSRPPYGLVNAGAMTPADVDWYRAAVLKPGAATAMLNYYRAFLRTQTLADQAGDDEAWGALRKRLDMPTLVLHGDRDAALGLKLLDGIEAAFPPGGVEVKVLQDCSHWVQQDYPLQVNGIMRDWLRRKA